MATSRTKAPAAKKTAATRAKTTTKAVPKAATSKKVAATAKVTAKTTVAKKPAVPATKTTAKTVVKKTATKAASRQTSPAAPSAEDRYRMVQEAAYFIAEKNGFAGGDMSYWIEAEAQINKLLSGK